MDSTIRQAHLADSLERAGVRDGYDEAADRVARMWRVSRRAAASGRIARGRARRTVRITSRAVTRAGR